MKGSRFRADRMGGDVEIAAIFLDGLRQGRVGVVEVLGYFLRRIMDEV